MRRRQRSEASKNDASKSEASTGTGSRKPAADAANLHAAEYLLQQVDAKNLLWFRRAFAVGTAIDSVVCFHREEFVDYFDSPGRIHFDYPWPLPSVQPLPASAMRWLPCVSVAFAALFASGAAPRCGLVSFTLLAGYIFLVDAARYVNHYYLYVLVGTLLSIAAIDGDGQSRTRRLHLWLLRAQFTIIYLYGGLAKCNWEWLLRQEPLRTYLRQATRPGRLLHAPVASALIGSEWFISSAAAFALAYDLMIGFALWRRRWLWPCIILSSLFHLTNGVLFNTIGSFPYVSLASTCLFLTPSSVTLSSSVNSPGRPATTLETSLSLRVIPPRSVGGRARLACAMLWLGAQALLPLRHHLLSTDVSWTKLGNEFSWRLMSETCDGWVSLTIVDPASGRHFQTHPHSSSAPVTLTAHAIQQLLASPTILEQYIQAEVDAASRALSLSAPPSASPSTRYGPLPPRPLHVFAECWKSINGRPFQRWCDPSFDWPSLANRSRSRGQWMEHPPWMLPHRALGSFGAPSGADVAASAAAAQWRARGYSVEMFTDGAGRPAHRDRIVRSSGYSDARLLCTYGACSLQHELPESPRGELASLPGVAVLQAGEWAQLRIGGYYSVGSASTAAHAAAAPWSSWLYVMK